MEFSAKLQTLRKQKGLTQEELAGVLYVSRTAISKWESGRGTPNLESLKAIGKFFGLSLDALLSGEELLTAADEEAKKRETRIRDLVFGLLDCGMLLFLFLPLFAQRGGKAVTAVSLFALTDTALFVRAAVYAVVFGCAATGILTLALQNSDAQFWVKHKYALSVGFGVAAVCIFVLTLHPYAAILAFGFLVVKVFILLKRR